MAEQHPRIEDFESRIASFDKEVEQVEKKIGRIAFQRGLVFLVFAALTWYVWSFGWYYSLGSLFAGLMLFLILVKRHQQTRKFQGFLKMQKRINEEEILRLNGEIDGFFDGKEFDHKDHPYSCDLDLFGPISLFQLINRTTTIFGKRTLAKWLNGVNRNQTELDSRQAGVKELAEKIDWRQEFEAHGRVSLEDGTGEDTLRNLLEMDSLILENKGLRIAPYILVPLLILAILAASLGWIPGGMILLLLIPAAIVNRFVAKRTKGILERTEKQHQRIIAFLKLIRMTEKLETDVSGLMNVKQKLGGNGLVASEKIRELSRIFNSLELRYSGSMYVVLNLLIFWDIYWYKRLDKWRKECRDEIGIWFEAIGEMETYASFAGLAYAQTDWTWPEFHQDKFIVVGDEVGHPLIAADKRVANPVSFNTRGEVMLITGSNMSGKSTYLRTIGINLILAYCGAPVCANSLELSPMSVYTSMRTEDALEENTSSFYAELKRLKMVLDIAEEGEKQVFFLLDEILKGTNSKDRHKGAIALVKQLHRAGAVGMVSTHDLELSNLEQELPGFVRNFSFLSSLKGETELSFDYQLKDGVCKSFNASQLMKNMGIEVEVDWNVRV